MNARRQWKKRQRRRTYFQRRKRFLVGCIILTGICVSVVFVNFKKISTRNTVTKATVHSEIEVNSKETVKFETVEKMIEIEMKAIEPEILIAKHTISHASSLNRDQNLARAAEIINGDTDGFILNPNEKFSYIEVIGNPTIKKGFKRAGEIRNGKPTTGIGGGVCQVMSTINSAIQKTDQKTNSKYLHAEGHTLPSTYIKTERGDKEASVAYSSGKDFWFINSLDYSIRIYVRTKKGNVTVEIFAIKKEVSN